MIEKPGIPPIERWIAAFLLCSALLLRLLYAWHFRIDSDEPQHLHVVWAWANGLLPYRDVFDNHAPLFQALNAPLFHLMGVRPDILLPMRLAIIPIFALTIWCVWKISITFFSPHTALWTALLAVFLPPFFFISVEFRPDQLWTLAWMLTLVVLVTKRATPGRAFIAGLLLGAAFSVSMKSVLMLVTLALALGCTLLLSHRDAKPIPWRRLSKCAGAGLLGLAIIPALTVLFFVTNHAGSEMYDCIIQHNILPSSQHFGELLKSTFHWLILLLLLIPGIIVVTWLDKPSATRSRITFVFLTANLYYLTLACFWPILTDEDYLPFFPAWMLTIGPAVVWLSGKAAVRLRLPTYLLPMLLVLAEVLWIVLSQSPLQNETSDKIGIISDTLKLTQPNDFVMDSKGETIYRNRPFRYVLERLTIYRIKSGLIKDNIVERLIETSTPLVTLRRMPDRDHEFISANYLPIAFRLLALGKLLKREDSSPNAPYVFDVAIPSRYTFVCPSSQPIGILDGTPFIGSRELAAGPHEFRRTGGDEPLALCWATAIERGYSPFAKIKPDYKTKQD